MSKLFKYRYNLSRRIRLWNLYTAWPQIKSTGTVTTTVPGTWYRHESQMPSIGFDAVSTMKKIRFKRQPIKVKNTSIWLGLRIVPMYGMVTMVRKKYSKFLTTGTVKVEVKSTIRIDFLPMLPNFSLYLLFWNCEFFRRYKCNFLL